MKKTNFLKFALTLVMAFVMTGAWAQLATTNADMASSATTDYVTINKSVPYYVQPDNILSPSFNAAVSLTANVNTTFVWDWPVAPGAVTATDATVGDNYIELSFGTVGTYTVRATETFNSCPGTPVTQTVEVINAPTASISGSTANVNYSWSGAPYTDCLPATPGTETITVTITEDSDLPQAYRSYAFLVNEHVYNVLAVDLTTQDGADVANNDYDYTVASKIKAGHPTLTANPTHTWTPNDVGTATSTYALPTQTLNVRNSKPTRYDYTLTYASDAALTTGIVSAISHKCDYGTGAILEYAFTGTTTVSYIVLPAPVTGPIYHISNTWAY